MLLLQIVVDDVEQAPPKGALAIHPVGRSHQLSLEPAVLSEAADWMDRQRALWGRLFDVVDEYLKEDASR